jgi:methionyl-tRNA formyltransferase
MKIAAQGGYIHLLQIQLPGKRKMGIKDVLNGLNLDSKAHVV